MIRLKVVHYGATGCFDAFLVKWVIHVLWTALSKSAHSTYYKMLQKEFSYQVSNALCKCEYFLPKFSLSLHPLKKYGFDGTHLG